MGRGDFRFKVCSVLSENCHKIFLLKCSSALEELHRLNRGDKRENLGETSSLLIILITKCFIVVAHNVYVSYVLPLLQIEAQRIPIGELKVDVENSFFTSP